MKKLKTIFTERWLGYTATAVIAVLLYEMLEHLDRLKPAFSGIWSFISPILIGIAIAYLFDPVADDFFERKLLRKIKKENTRHLLGIILTIICILLIIALLLVALIPSVTQSISKMVSNWDVYTQKVQTLLKKGAEFAKSHGLLHVLPLLCNSDFFGISEIHGRLIRCGTCGNSDKCDYLVVGSKNEMTAEYETVTDEQGFLVSRRIEQKN